MKKTTLHYVFGFVFCLISMAVFSQDSENVIMLEMPSESAEVATTSTAVITSETENSTETETNPIYIADGVVIKNLNVLDPSTIIAVDVVDNKIIITTNRATKNTSRPVLAANI